MRKLMTSRLYLRILLPAVLTGLLVVDGLLGYVAPDPFDGIELVTQKAAAATELPELELQEANEERVVPQGTAGKLSNVNESGTYKDGVYTGTARGFGGNITVSVTIKDGKIKSIKIVSAPGEGKSYLSRASVLTGRIVKAQSTNVDAVSGATYSSNGIIKAVRKALAKARADGKTSAETASDTDDAAVTPQPQGSGEKPEALTGGNWTDGVYTGKGIGFGGELTVQVTITDGKITAVELVSTLDTEEYMDLAKASILPAVIEAQGTGVDTVTGATYSSNGLLEAINDALRQAAGQEEDTRTDTGGDTGGGGSADTDKYEYKDGSYSKTVACTRTNWFDYDINVEMTIKDGRITSVSVSKGKDYTDEDYQEDNDEYLDLAANGYGSRPGMKAKIISAQSADVDVVTGATYSSNAIKNAASEILSGIKVKKEIVEASGLVEELIPEDEAANAESAETPETGSEEENADNADNEKDTSDTTAADNDPSLASPESGGTGDSSESSGKSDSTESSSDSSSRTSEDSKSSNSGSSAESKTENKESGKSEDKDSSKEAEKEKKTADTDKTAKEEKSGEEAAGE